MAKERRDCLTCKWEPVWGEFGPEGYRYVRGQCRFPNGHKALRTAKLPQDSQISTPWMGLDEVKHNCLASAAKDGETE